MDDYLDRFKAMVEELKAHPDVVVTHFNIFPPASERSILRAGHEFCAEIPQDFMLFYRRTNGLQLRWLWRNTSNFEKLLAKGEKYPELSYDSVYEDDGGVAGCINIQPIQNVFWNTSFWKEIVYFEEDVDKTTMTWDGNMYPFNAFRKALVPIDYYHFFYSTLLLSIEKGDDLPLLHSSGYFKNVEWSGFSSFQQYLGFLLASKGVVIGRLDVDFFKSKGKELSNPLGNWHQLDLDRLSYDETERRFSLGDSGE